MDFKKLGFKKLDFKKLVFKKLDLKKLVFKKLDFKKLGLKSEYHGHLAPYAQFLMIGNEGEEGERRLIDLHGFAAGKKQNFT